MEKKQFPYIHGFSKQEQERLWKQSQVTEQSIFGGLDLSDMQTMLEVGCGIGAQTAILLRRYPDMQLNCIDVSQTQLEAARANLSQIPDALKRVQFDQMNANHLTFPAKTFDGAFLCWVLEHTKNQSGILSEVRRVLKPGGRVIISEVMNSSLFLDPYAPAFWQYWQAFNDFQFEQAGDPFVGCKLGNLLLSQGFQNIKTKVKIWHYDNRWPEKRSMHFRNWKSLLLSAAPALLAARKVDQSLVEAMKTELEHNERNPNAVFYYNFMQAEAEV